MTRLYPPSIAGTLPSFYKNKDENGTTYLVVPFSANKTVNQNKIIGYSLRIKTANTDIIYGILEQKTPSHWSQDISNPWVEFQIPDTILNRLTIGSFYKVQLAYIGTTQIGYYSSVGVIKYTAEPSVHISDFSLDKINISQTEYIGIYENILDPSEKVYQYKFNLYTRDNTLLNTTNWKIHNSYADEAIASSIDHWLMPYTLQPNIIYKINYEIITNNNLHFTSPSYLIMDAEQISPEIKVILGAELDYDNACINLSLTGEKMKDGSEHVIIGQFLLSRASSLDNFSSWFTISDFQMSGERPSSFIMKDFTIEHGVTYIYSLQQYNNNHIYSSRFLTDKIEAAFEDIFLYDGEKQLKIRFNPKVTSFKTVYQESKKNTLGSKYPYIFRNGITAYKEFQISGLLSYLMDNDKHFVSKEELFLSHVSRDSTDITDKNVLAERLFKLKVMDWLGNGEAKLFKSPQEGNYIIRLMNTSLSPIDSVSRMLHTFNSQAVEVADYTTDNLFAFNFIQINQVSSYQMRWETISIENRIKERATAMERAQQLFNEGHYTEARYKAKIQEIETTLYPLYGYDLLRGERAYHLKIQNMIPGIVFTFIDSNNNHQEIMIGSTGAYEFYSEDPIRELIMVSPGEVQLSSQGMNRKGQITFGFRTAQQNRFDTIEEVAHQNIPVLQEFGPNTNILSDYQNLKMQIARINYAKFTKANLVDIYSSAFAEKDDLNSGILMTGIIEELDENAVYDIQTLNQRNEIVHSYYRYFFSQDKYINFLKQQYLLNFNEEYDKDKIWPSGDFKTDKYNAWFKIKTEENKTNMLDKKGKLYAYPHFSSFTQIPIIMQAFVWYKDSINNCYYRLLNNELALYENITEDPEDRYHLSYKDLNPYTVYRKRSVSGEDTYYKFNGASLEEIQEYSTKIIYGNSQIDIGETGYREFYDTDVPDKIEIGSGVIAELGLQVKHITYDIEDSPDCEKTLLEYLNKFISYSAMALHLKKVMKPSELNLENHYEIWDQYAFVYLPLTQELINIYTILYENNSANFEDLNIYTPTEEIASLYNIQKAYRDMIEARQAYCDTLEEILKEKEKENAYG